MNINITNENDILLLHFGSENILDLSKVDSKLVDDIENKKILSYTIEFKDEEISGDELIDSFEEGMDEDFKEKISLLTIKIK